MWCSYWVVLSAETERHPCLRPHTLWKGNMNKCKWPIHVYFWRNIFGLLKRVLVLRSLDTTWKSRQMTMLQQNAVTFPQSSFLRTISLCALAWTAGIAEIKPLWDAIEELFLHVQIVQAFWYKSAGLETPLFYNFPNYKTSSLATHRLPAIEGMNKCNRNALISRAVPPLEGKPDLCNCSSRIMKLPYPLHSSSLSVRDIFVTVLPKMCFIGLAYCFESQCIR